MNPYELEKKAFSLPDEDKVDAFLVLADAFEEAGNFKAAEVRRSWAETLCIRQFWIKFQEQEPRFFTIYQLKNFLNLGLLSKDADRDSEEWKKEKASTMLFAKYLIDKMFDLRLISKHDETYYRHRTYNPFLGA